MFNVELINCIRRYQNPNEILLALILHEENKYNYYNREEATPSYIFTNVSKGQEGQLYIRTRMPKIEQLS